MRKLALPLAIIALALPLLPASPAQAQAPRTWVSGTGNDSNPCSRTAPCKTFAGALANNKTAPGGEINCLDPGGFDTVTITFALTISCEVGTAGALGGLAININAATTDVVTLRGLDIDGQGTGGVGIYVQSAKAVHIEKSTIRNFRSGFVPAGILTGGNGTVFLYLTNTVISDNGYGIALGSSGGFKVVSLKNVTITGSTLDGVILGGQNVYVNVTDSIISGNGHDGILANASNTTANIDRSTLANNSGAALDAAVSGATIRASGNNIFNNTNGILIASGASVQSDGVNKHGNSNGGVAPNGVFAQY